MELTFDTCAYLSALFHSFLSLASHLARILAMQTIGQIVGKRLTTLILHEVLITKWEDCSSVDDWKRFYVSFDDLCWSTREFFVAPEFRLTYKLFELKSFWSLVDHCGILRSPLQVIFYRNICTTIGFAVVLVLPTLMSANFQISDHGVFFLGPSARNRSYTMVNHRAFKTYPKISNSEFLSRS